MTLLPFWSDVSIQMAPIHLVVCHCGPRGALDWGLGPSYWHHQWPLAPVSMPTVPLL